MPVPKRRKSISQSRKQRSANIKSLKKVKHSLCKNCGEIKIPHHICKFCGKYASKKILNFI